MFKPLAFVGTGAITLTAPVLSHHSPIIFRQDTVANIQGVVRRFDRTNPHVYIFVKSADAVGQPVEWQIETDPVPILSRNEWTTDSLQPGDLVSASVHPDRIQERAHALLVTFEKAGGTVLTPISRANSERRQIPRATGVTGRWEQYFDNILRTRLASAEIVVTEKGAAAKPHYDIQTTRWRNASRTHHLSSSDFPNTLTR